MTDTGGSEALRQLTPSTEMQIRALAGVPTAGPRCEVAITPADARVLLSALASRPLTDTSGARDEAWARKIADDAVQRLADSEPDGATMEAQDVLEGTEAESHFVVSSATLFSIIYCAISDQVYDDRTFAAEPSAECVGCYAERTDFGPLCPKHEAESEKIAADVIATMRQKRGEPSADAPAQANQ